MKKEPILTKEVKNPVETRPLVRELEPMKETKVTFNLPLIIAAIAIIIAGAFTGFILVRGSVSAGSKNGGVTSGTDKKIVGSSDEKTFKDSADGILREGGVDGEGSHHLERSGGPSQDVYLTSSTIPLDDYIGKKVKVWGETFAAEKAGWFMDVGKLELLE
ncbi:MAG: hypothetical protein AAB874_05410 [Patescibacteria group bacterium]